MKKLLYMVNVLDIYSDTTNGFTLTVKAEDKYDAIKKARGVIGKYFIDKNEDPRHADSFYYESIRLRTDKKIFYNSWSKMTEKEIEEELDYISEEINAEKFNYCYKDTFNEQYAKYKGGIIPRDTLFKRMYIKIVNGTLEYDFRKWNEDLRIDILCDTGLFDWMTY